MTPASARPCTKPKLDFAVESAKEESQTPQDKWTKRTCFKASREVFGRMDTATTQSFTKIQTNLKALLEP